MTEWNIGFGNALKDGEKIIAIVRHYKDKTGETDKEVKLTQTSDGFYIDESPDELAYSWNVVKWKSR